MDAVQSDGIERRPVRHPVGVRRNEAQMDMAFVAPVLATPTKEIRTMVRPTDRVESQRAAVDVLPHVSKLQRRLLEIFALEGAYTDGELESRKEFAHLKFSTIRKRRTELYQAGWLVDVGRREKMTLWGLTPGCIWDGARTARMVP